VIGETSAIQRAAQRFERFRQERPLESFDSTRDSRLALRAVKRIDDAPGAGGHTARRAARHLAERLKKPPSFIAKIEIGERRLDVAEFAAIAKALKIDPRTLFDRFLNW
jgi:transcriptional regulator with XRE-family HTH domain